MSTYKRLFSKLNCTIHKQSLLRLYIIFTNRLSFLPLLQYLLLSHYLDNVILFDQIKIKINIQVAHLSSSSTCSSSNTLIKQCMLITLICQRRSFFFPLNYHPLLYLQQHLDNCILDRATYFNVCDLRLPEQRSLLSRTRNEPIFRIAK